MGGQVIAGPSNSVVIDKNGMYWMAGKVQFVSLLMILCTAKLTEDKHELTFRVQNTTWICLHTAIYLTLSMR